MHPFGGTPICPRCRKAVYAAEQIMGPGRKLYHKPCLTCTTCGKRLDSYNLVEHDQEPYCKNCHVKNFGTRDLRLANLPNRDEVFLSSPPTSPGRGSFLPIQRTASPPNATVPAPTAPPFPARRQATGAPPAPPLLRPTRTFSPVRATFADPRASPTAEEFGQEGALTEEPVSAEPGPTHTGRVGGLPRTIPLNLSPSKGRVGSPAKPTAEATASSTSPTLTRPLLPTVTGTRYGAALGGGATASHAPVNLGGHNPLCGRCGKTVYFAEQMKAIGKTWHKGCLRCTECGTLLDSTRLTEREGSPFCQRCYGKLYGPQGSGYALLGRAGA